MLTNRALLVFLLVSTVTPATAQAQVSGESLAIMPEDVVWKAPAVRPGVETAITFGDPTKPGPYVLRQVSSRLQAHAAFPSR
jgi:hypothetical protein